MADFFPPFLRLAFFGIADDMALLRFKPLRGERPVRGRKKAGPGKRPAEGS